MSVHGAEAERAAAELREAARDRGLHARRWSEQGRPVVGYVGGDTPVELLTAAGALPVRLAGRPGRDTGLARTYLDGAVDPLAVDLLQAVLAPQHGDPVPDLIVLTHDRDASVQLFYTLRELRRIGAHPLPPVHLLDLLHLPGEPTLRYNLGRMRRFAGQLAAWRGRALDPAGLAAAVAEHNTARAARRALRRHRTGALSGTEALRWYLAGTAMPPGHYARTLTTALTGTPAPAPGRRLYLRGSSHDGTGVYQALEEEGWLVAGEDHDWADGGVQPPVPAATLEALTEHYTRAVLPPAARSASSTAEATRAALRDCRAEYLLTYCRRHDDAPRWDHPGIAAAAGLPAGLAHDQHYGSIDLAAAADLLPIAEGRTP